MNSNIVLKRLEVQGFKSFADKECIKFSPKTNAILGPLAGKSNLLEAIRWVLTDKTQVFVASSTTKNAAETEGLIGVTMSDIGVTKVISVRWQIGTNL